MTFIGTAGWAIPSSYRDRFPAAGSHLERYATRFTCVEINSSFYRRHKKSTYQRWAAAVPKAFRFSVKVPRSITQNHRLTDYGDLLQQFLEEVSGLDGKLGVLLAQLPPSLAYDAEVASRFFQELVDIGVPIACEPRHTSWFTPEVEQSLKNLHVARVAADPPRATVDHEPGGDMQLAYFRMHGSPKIYYSDYSQVTISELALRLRKKDWCIFDNTAASCALGNALTLDELKTSSAPKRNRAHRHLG